MKTWSMPRRSLLLLLAAFSAATCGRGEGTDAPPLSLAFDLVEAPDVFEYIGPATVADASEPGGLWASVPGLPRPERGVVRVETTGRALVLALFRAPAGGGLALSAMAAERLGLGEAASAPATVRAVRSEPRLRRNDTAF